MKGIRHLRTRCLLALAVVLSEPAWSADSSVQGTGQAGQLHHFVIDPMPNPAYLSDYATVFIRAADAQGNFASYNGPVYVEAVSAGLTNYHWDFEDGTLQGWTPLNPGYWDGPYEVLTFETGGERVNGVVGFPSLAFRIRPNSGPIDGLTRTVQLVGGVPYHFSFSIAESNEGPNWEYAGARAQLLVNGTSIGGAGWSQYDFIVPGWVNRAKMLVSYTPPTNGNYTLTLAITRDSRESDLYAYVDDIRIQAPRVTPLLQLMWVGLSVGQAIVRVHDLATNITLRAYDLDGHAGYSNPFDVLPSADVYPATGAYPTGDGVNSYEEVTILTEIHNAGPSPATDVVVTNVLPPDFQVQSVSTDGAALTNYGNTIVCSYSHLAPGAAGSLTIQARTAGEGLRTNLVTVTANEHDPIPDNNRQLNHLLVQPPELHVSDATVTESPGGTNALLTLWLTSSNDVPASVEFTTANLGANASADYQTASGTVSFAPGETNQTLALTVLDDPTDESNETFYVQLSNPNHALLADALRTVTIVDDDPPPSLTIQDTTVLEGDADITQAGFAAALSAPSELIVTVFYSASPGTAQPGSDYLAPGDGAYVSFLPSQTQQTISIPVRGNTVNEPDETFFVTLASAQNATIARAQATATILNDDAVPGRLDHFLFGPMAPARRAQIPFPIRVSAVDAFGGLVTNYGGSAFLSAPDAADAGVGRVVPGAISNFVQGIWTGAVAINKAFTNGTLLAQDDAEHIGQSDPFKVLWAFPLSVTLPASAQEGAGVLANAGRLTTLYTNESDIELVLSSSDTNVLRVSNTVLPAGQTNVSFDVAVLEDTLLNATRTATISATGPGFESSAASMQVLDNESTNLALIMSFQGPYWEGAGTITNFRQIRIGGALPTNLVVELTSTDLTELTVPSSVTVLAGQIFSRFSATLPEDDELDGLQNVRLIASAPGFSSATNVIPVEDNDPHHFVFNAIASPQTSAVPFLVSLSARDVNDTPIVYNDGRVLLSALAGTRLLPLSPSQVTFGRRGSWSGSVQVNSWGTNVQIKAAASHGVFSLSNPFLVVPPPWSGPPTILTQDGYFGLNKGKFGFSFRAEQGSVAVVEASTNLTDWLPLQTNLLGEWEVQFFEDLDADRFTRRFYRLQVK